MDESMMFGHVVAIVFFARGSLVSELSTKICHGANGISCPSILVFEDVVVDNAKCYSVVCLHWCWKSRMPHEFKGTASWDSFLTVDVESAHFGLCCQ